MVIHRKMQRKWLSDIFVFPLPPNVFERTDICKHGLVNSWKNTDINNPKTNCGRCGETTCDYMSDIGKCVELSRYCLDREKTPKFVTTFSRRKEMMSVQKFKKNGIIISHKHNPINQKSSRRKQRSIESDYWSVHRAWQLDCKRFITNRGDIISAGLSGLSIESVTYRDNQALLWLLQIKIEEPPYSCSKPLIVYRLSPCPRFMKNTRKKRLSLVRRTVHPNSTAVSDNSRRSSNFNPLWLTNDIQRLLNVFLPAVTTLVFRSRCIFTMSPTRLDEFMRINELRSQFYQTARALDSIFALTRAHLPRRDWDPESRKSDI
ncbi:hypothetical protein CLF_109031 [Clonorchis sinensis]|uniref:Uncharacterized protein n=1 Tax=Clonorchis sinensis TaxID=79923 RepID=G7YIU6_CLOSI|nr:hypothetical protein CLF_109031 [Clonorchis sinensis]